MPIPRPEKPWQYVKPASRRWIPPHPRWLPVGVTRRKLRDLFSGRLGRQEAQEVLEWSSTELDRLHLSDDTDVTRVQFYVGWEQA